MKMNFICRRFGTLFHFHRHPPMKMEQCSETSEDKIQTPENYPEESIRHSEHGRKFEINKHNFPPPPPPKNWLVKSVLFF